ncbi:DUF6787 family protein [Pararhodonellum marinum]|uniref:DUF6787 family protein n=1 Tax=Pararhodonellum marinum TaxID=2755358 RepID=UPI001E3D37A1|nr:DUF6787 family protein [Pararhodonellum marinum]
MQKESTPKSGFLQKLRSKWQLKSIWQVVLVLLVFALTGFTVLFIKKPLFDFLGISLEKGGFWKTVLYLIFVLPLYQLILLFYGFLLGQFHFFWEKEKLFFRRVGKVFSSQKKTP